ncbi:MAG TPA: hypothetical protein VNN73_08655 [Blastocatellia bacterium]|nr:hypothetical protein [Blastocatellia bacterium]
MRLRIKSATVFISILLLCAAALAQESEKPVKMKDLPAAVRKTAREQSKGAAIRGLSKEVEDGKTFYEVELRVGGHSKDVLIDETGAVVEIEEQVSLASIPQAARAAIEKQVGGGKIASVESITRKGAIVAYEAHIKTGNKYREVKVSPDGQLLPD